MLKSLTHNIQTYNMSKGINIQNTRNNSIEIICVILLTESACLVLLVAMEKHVSFHLIFFLI
jgi:hypothetical protein